LFWKQRVLHVTHDVSEQLQHINQRRDKDIIKIEGTMVLITKKEPIFLMLYNKKFSEEIH
jgi:uncharacterized Fe-S cluster-containing radical SAM superfamily protein